jgi:hypothetical protein
METRLLAGNSRHPGSFPGRIGMLYPSPNIQTGSRAYTAFCSVGTGNAFRENEAAGA